MSLLSQIVVGVCLLLLVIVLFFDEQDYLSFSVLFVFISTLVTAIEIESARELQNIVDAIDWEIIFFLIAMFTIVEILNEAKVFHQIAKLIVVKFHSNRRLMFYVICIVSTLSATIIEDLSVAIIFIPIIIISCKNLKINPAPFLLGMTICINLAATLTPFGSAQNLMISNYFEIERATIFFLRNFSIYFIITTAITLILLDFIILRKNLNESAESSKSAEITEHVESLESKKSSGSGDGACVDSKEQIDLSLEEFEIEPNIFLKNLIGLGIFIILLLTIPKIHIAGILGMLLFIFLNMKKSEKGHYHPQLSKYLRKIDYKLIYFFMCLYVFVFLMDENGTLAFFETQIQNLNIQSTFILALLILILTSILSGFIDNAPVTIMFLPIVKFLTENPNIDQIPLLVAFVLGINLGGNFLPQGSAADMMTLELSQKNCVEGITYKRLVKVGGLFALLHLGIGIIYIAIMVFLL